MNIILPPGPVSIPGEPTDAPPGSTRKIRVLIERATRRESLFHPSDNLQRVPLPPRSSGEEELEEMDTLAEEENLEEDEEYEADLAG